MFLHLYASFPELPPCLLPPLYFAFTIMDFSLEIPVTSICAIQLPPIFFSPSIFNCWLMHIVKCQSQL